MMILSRNTNRCYYTDPPRDGMHKDVIEQIMKIAPAKVVYVSCNWLHKLEI
jgi:tRNA/tmRNA/rRNA uracil-C5-methylase (TrmA/RlmC/RlmD family)